MEHHATEHEPRIARDERAPGAQTRLTTMLAATAAGDRTAFEQLYRLTSPQIFALCSKMLRRDDLAEEVLQDTFVQVWRRAGDYDERRAAPMTWIARIARNRAIDIIRRRRFESEGDSEKQALDRSEAHEPGPLEQSLQWARYSAVQRCLDVLSAVQREAVLLAFFRGYTHQELAGVLAAPVGTVKSRIRQGLQRLKGCLEA